jgi:hypothetical protein
MAKGMVKKLFKGKDTYGEELAEAKAIKAGRISPQQYASGEKMEDKMACGGKIKGRSGGGLARGGGAATRGKNFSGTF